MQDKKTLLTKVIIGVAAVAVIIAGVIFLPRLMKTGTISPANQTDLPGAVSGIDGKYDGDYKKGVRSGWGTWEYGNYYYEGYWENDMPNGEGTLYIAKTPPEDRQQDANYTVQNAVVGFFIDGYAHGPITYYMHLESGDNIAWEFELDMGYPLRDDTIIATNGMSDRQVKQSKLMGGVPPWADVKVEGIFPETIYELSDSASFWEREQSHGYSFANDEPLPITSLTLYWGGDTVGIYNSRFFYLQLDEGNVILHSRNLDGSDIRKYPEVSHKGYDSTEIIIRDGYAYFYEYNSTIKKSCICRVSLTNGEKEILLEAEQSLSIRFIDTEHVYYFYSGADFYTMHRCALDGSDAEIVWDAEQDLRRYDIKATVSNSLICLLRPDTSSDGDLWKIIAKSISGGNETVLADVGVYLAQIGDYVYYATKEGDLDTGEGLRYGLYRVRVDGSERTPLLNDDEGLVGATSRFGIGNNAIYCAVEKYPLDALGDDMQRIDICTYRMKLDGSDRVRLMDDFMSDLTIGKEEDDLFFRSDGSGMIGKLDAETGRAVLFEDTRGAFRLLLVEDGWVYYYMYSGDTDTYCRVRTDGTENMVLFNY